jgi:hypothetical protein
MGELSRLAKSLPERQQCLLHFCSVDLMDFVPRTDPLREGHRQFAPEVFAKVLKAREYGPSAVW